MSAYISVTELFSIGIGPSSSHTVGPMRAAADFAARLTAEPEGGSSPVARVTCVLYGALGATGIGHGTPDAIVAGLTGMAPETCDPQAVAGGWQRLGEGRELRLDGASPVRMATDDIRLAPLTRKPAHPNAMTLTAFDASGAELAADLYYSVGGGFIVREGAPASTTDDRASVPHPFSTAAELLAICASTGRTVAEIAADNEQSLVGAATADAAIARIWATMTDCVDAGLGAEGVLPGGLQVPRRAATMSARLRVEPRPFGYSEIDWLHAYALAVNEENAAGGRVVTAPTNGAAGIIPAVGLYYARFMAPPETPDMRTYLLTATAIGSLFKANASISGAEAGCQGEVGTACAMAAGGLCAVLGGSPAQIENAAEIAMEHHLGLTCDPVGGLVQIPCIERNAIASVTAVSAARMALNGEGTHMVSLDTVIETMRQTGIDMSDKYKETSTGGLALNVVLC